MAPAVHRRRTMTRRTLVILDEIHHAGDSRSWGDGVKAAFEPAVRRLMLTGTPFRSDDNPIPFVTYERGEDGLQRSRSDSIVRLRRRAARRRRPAGDLPGVLGRDPVAHQRRRRAGRPARRADDPGPGGAGLADRAGPPRRLDAAGAAGRRRPAVPAARARHARRRRPGHRQRPADRPGVREAARARSPARRPWWCSPTTRAPPAGSPRSPPPSSAGWSRSGWSPRASTSRAWPSACTPPAPPPRCTSPRRSAASCGPAAPARPPRCSCPACRTCWGWPARWRPQRDHVLGAPKDPDGLDDDLLERAQRAEDAERRAGEAVRGAVRHRRAGPGDLRRRLVRHRRPTGTPEEEEYLGLPGLLSPDQVAVLLTKRQAEQIAAQKRQQAGRAGARPSVSRRRPDDRGGAARSACAASSTRWWRPTTTAPTCRTARSTRSCAGCAAARRAPRPPSSSSRSGSPRSRRCDRVDGVTSTERRGPDTVGARRSRDAQAPYGAPSRVSLVGVRHHVRAAPAEVRIRRELHGDLHQVFGVPVGVVSAEHQLAATSQGQTELAGCVAAVAPFIGCWYRPPFPPAA